MADEGYIPPTAFYFELTILDSPNSPWPTAVDGSFQEISGIDRELEVQAVPEGGENRFAHQLPKRGRHPNLVLRRGIVFESSALASWAETTIASDFSKPIKTRTLMVTLLSAPKKLIVWTFSDAYPVKWSTAGFKAMDNALAVETLEMAYGAVKREIKDNG
jgi:phage tail-like protein